jgi:hypothetical protein
MLRQTFHRLVICASRPRGEDEVLIPRMRWIAAFECFLILACCLVLLGGLRAATVPAGFTETPVSGPWSDAVGLTFESNGRMYVWERTGRVWFKDPTDSSPSLLLDISEEVGAWDDHGMLGFALDPNFRANGYIYLLYVVDRYYLLNFGIPGYNPNANQYNGDDRAADALHVQLVERIPVGEFGQPIDLDWRNKADGHPNMQRRSRGWQLGVR